MPKRSTRRAEGRRARRRSGSDSRSASGSRSRSSSPRGGGGAAALPPGGDAAQPADGAAPPCLLDLNLPPPATAPDHPRVLIPELLKQFCALGWVTCGGGISIRVGNEIYMAPSGVPKDAVKPDDLYVFGPDGCEVRGPPAARGLKHSDCMPIFMLAYRLRNAGAVLHSHSKHVARATLLTSAPYFQVTHLEMIKGVRNDATGAAFRYDDILKIPIVENTASERELTDSMERAMIEHPETSVVMVRHHGMYVWGKTWHSAKVQAEAIEFLCDIAVSMKLLGIDASKPLA